MIHVCAKCGALVDTSTGPAGRTVCPPCWTDGWRVDAFGNVYRVDVVVGAP